MKLFEKFYRVLILLFYSCTFYSPFTEADFDQNTFPEIPQNSAYMGDFFSANSYDNNNGTLNWNTSWVEEGESDGPTTGYLSVKQKSLKIGKNYNKTAPFFFRLSREANLSQFNAGELSFIYKREKWESNGTVLLKVEVSPFPGSSMVVQTLTPGEDENFTKITRNITPFISTETRIIISIEGTGTFKGGVYLDNIIIRGDL